MAGVIVIMLGVLLVYIGAGSDLLNYITGRTPQGGKRATQS